MEVILSTFNIILFACATFVILTILSSSANSSRKIYVEFTKRLRHEDYLDLTSQDSLDSGQNPVLKKKPVVNLIYFNDPSSPYGNFGDELSKFVTQKLINQDKYHLVFNHDNPTEIDYNLLVIGSYLHNAKNNTVIYGSGVRTNPAIEGRDKHAYSHLNVTAVRGPLTRDFLIKQKGIQVPEIYGDPALLLPLFYTPELIKEYSHQTCILPHKSHLNKYLDDKSESSTREDRYKIISPLEPWQAVVNKIYSCQTIISSSLHGLIVADAYHKSNVWLNQYSLSEGDLKFKDYFLSQHRERQSVSRIEEVNDLILYSQGNQIDLNMLESVFPFS